MKNEVKQVIFSTILLSILLVFGCKNDQQNDENLSDSFYTCPMHPTVESSSAGSCPVCNMSLIKVERVENENSGLPGNFITIDKHRQELAGIKTDTVKLRNISSAASIIGIVAIDEELVKTISSRAKGRIDKLFVKSTGQHVKHGSPLYSIYSEQLQADEKEYLSLLEMENKAGPISKWTNELIVAAKNKLLLWGMSKTQIAELEKTGETNPLITFFSSESGYVTEVNITEGMYVEEGSKILGISSLNQVWVNAQIYSNEITATSGSKTFQVYSESNPELVYNGKMVYSNPVIEEGKRIYVLKIRVNNSGGHLIPGTLVSVIPDKSSANVITVPKSAVLLEKMKTVWILAHDNTFEQRMVETGAENQFWIEIKSGLQPGEIVATEGVYLINSEFILKSGASQRHDH